jgi:TonB family protein
MGNKDGPGIGSGNGGGAGGGSKGGAGDTGTAFGSRDGTAAGPSVIDWRRPPSSGYIPFSWIRRAHPIVTPEAQSNKSAGTVLVRATLHSDGTITDIVLVNGVDFMSESAIDALQRSTFRPATLNGKALTLTNVLIKIEVHY